MILNIILGTIFGFLCSGILFYIFVLRKKDNSEELAISFEKKLTEMFPRILQNANEQLVLLADQKLGAEKQDIKTDLENKKNIIESLVKRIQEEVEKNNKNIESAERERVGSFRELKQEMESNRKITEQLSVTTDGLKKVLSNNQLRGQFGEQVAEDLLRMTGFVHGTDYITNKSQKESATRPDFTIFLPDSVRINVDAKFPYSHLQKMTESQDSVSKKEFLKLFENDIKEKIKQVTGREYINPIDNTVDFVIMFIPNEMIFSFIYDKMNHVWTEGMKQKVIFAGPFNFTAILRLIRQSYNNFKYQNNVNKIITHIRTFEDEFKKYNIEFEKIGERIKSLSTQYETVDSTRTRQLIKAVDKIKIEESLSSDSDPHLVPNVMATPSKLIKSAEEIS